MQERTSEQNCMSKCTLGTEQKSTEYALHTKHIQKAQNNTAHMLHAFCMCNVCSKCCKNHATCMHNTRKHNNSVCMPCACTKYVFAQNATQLLQHAATCKRAQRHSLNAWCMHEVCPRMNNQCMQDTYADNVPPKKGNMSCPMHVPKIQTERHAKMHTNGTEQDSPPFACVILALNAPKFMQYTWKMQANAVAVLHALCMHEVWAKMHNQCMQNNKSAKC